MESRQQLTEGCLAVFLDGEEPIQDGAPNLLAVSQDGLRCETLIFPTTGLPNMTIDLSLGGRKALPHTIALVCDTLCQDGKIRPAYWHYVDDLSTCGPRDRAFTYDPIGEQLLFGDGAHGAVPPRSQQGALVELLRDNLTPEPISNRELIEKKDELSLIMLIDKLRSAADFRALRELPEGYLEEITKDSPESVLKLMGKLMAVLLLRLNVPKEEIEEFTDRIERREFAMLFPNFEGYDVQETRRKSRAEGMAEGREKGITEGHALSVLSLLEDTGPVPEELRGRILEETDQETLERWLKLAARAGSIEDFKAQM